MKDRNYKLGESYKMLKHRLEVYSVVRTLCVACSARFIIQLRTIYVSGVGGTMHSQSLIKNRLSIG